MKTHIIHLEAYDDYASTSDQMAWAKSERILLVYPKRGKSDQTILDLILINRKATQLGSQLAIVSDDGQLADFAEENNIPVFSSIKKAQRESWGDPLVRMQVKRIESKKRLGVLRNQVISERRKRYPYENNWTRVIVFSLAVLAVILLLFVFVPSAVITLPLESRTQKIQITLFADPALNSPSLTGGVPVTINALFIEDRAEIASTGTIEIGDNPASGLVTISKNTPESVFIPEGTIFSTLSDPIIRFESTRTINLTLGVGETADIPVKAIEAGSQGNVVAGSIQAVEGALGTQITVVNSEAMVGGTDRSNPAPVEDDYEKLKSVLIEQLERKALDEIKKSTVEGKSIPVKILLKSIIKEELIPDFNSPSDVLALTMEAKMEVWVVKDQDILDAITISLEANIPSGYIAVPETLEIQEISDPLSTPINGKPQWKVTATQQIVPSWSAAEISQRAAGRKIDEVQEMLSASIDLAETATIEVKPFQCGILPIIPFQIEVISE
jgi:hypothetical protein